MTFKDGEPAVPEQNGIELRWIFTVIRRWGGLIAACAALAALVAFFVTAAMAPDYEATAILLVQPAQDAQSTEYSALVAGERLALTYSEMLKGRPVLDAVVAQYHLDETPDQLAKKVTAQPVRDTQLIRLTVKDSSPTRAVLLANGIAKAFTQYIQNLQMERYAGSQKTMQGRLNALSAQIDETQAEIQALNNAKNDLATKQLHLGALVAEYNSLRLTATTVTGRISVAEAARATSGALTPTATVTLLLDHSAAAGEANYSVETYGKMLAGRPILVAAIDRLGLDLDVDKLVKRVSVKAVPDTQLIELSVADADIAQAVRLADAIAQAFVDQMLALQQKPFTERMASLQTQIDDLQQQIGASQVDTQIAGLESRLVSYQQDYRTLQQDYSQMQLTIANSADAVGIAETASIPEESTQRRGLYIGLAALVSAALACGGAFLMEYLNDVVRTPEDVSQVVGLSTLGSISLMKDPESGPINLTQSRSAVAEAFRVLATNIRITSLDRPLRTILVTSPHAQEGKSLVAANLAAVLALRELKVVVIDADLRLPRLHRLYGIDQAPGLTDALLDGQDAGYLQPFDRIDGLKVLTSGGLPPNPAEVVASERMRRLLAALERDADLVLIDCPPVLPLADASILASIVDGILLVAHAERTRRHEMRSAVENLRKVGGRVVGVVLNGVPARSDSYYRYYREGPSDLQAEDGLGQGAAPAFGKNGSHEREGANGASGKKPAGAGSTLPRRSLRRRG